MGRAWRTRRRWEESIGQRKAKANTTHERCWIAVEVGITNYSITTGLALLQKGSARPEPRAEALREPGHRWRCRPTACVFIAATEWGNRTARVLVWWSVVGGREAFRPAIVPLLSHPIPSVNHAGRCQCRRSLFCLRGAAWPNRVAWKGIALIARRDTLARLEQPLSPSPAVSTRSRGVVACVRYDCHWS